MYLTCDDISVQYKNHLKKWDDLKAQTPGFKMTAFVIAGLIDKDLIDWLKQDWIEVGVHGWLHEIPECELEDKSWIGRALSTLKPLLPERYGFRAPGFQMTASTYPVIKDLGFWYIAHQTRVQPLKESINQEGLINTHVYDKKIKVPESGFRFISEGFNHNALAVPA